VNNQPFLSNLYDRPNAIIERLIDNIERVIVGKRHAVEQCVIALLAGGHVLLEDVPGTGKTMLVRAIAKSVDCEFRRIQFTPDLLPSDITGVSIFHPREDEFKFRKGPLFSQIVLADELNRTSPKTQAAMLEAMEEKQVTADGDTYKLPEPFIVLATQNPLDFAGTHRLPEAQLDRFLLSIRLGYPEQRHEVEMLGRLPDRHPVDTLRPVILREELLELQRLAKTVHVDDSLKRYMVQMTAATRSRTDVELGASPRGTIALMSAGQACAMARGRMYLVPDDIKDMAEAVLAHRVIETMEARMAGLSSRSIVRDIVAATPVPPYRHTAGA
jgi:MoxR-like ATPase